MAYCTDAQIEELLENAEGLRGPDEATLVARGLAAQAVVDGYLSGMGYAVPFADGAVPELVQTLTATRAAYVILRAVNSAGQFTDQVKELDIDFRNILKDLMGGRVTLPGKDPEPEDEASTTGVGSYNPHGGKKFAFGADGMRK